MRAMRAGLALVASVCVAPLGAPMAAQPVLETGTRIRIWLPDSVMPADAADRAGARIGVVARMDASTLVLRVRTSERRAVPLAVLTRIDVSAGRPTHRVAGALLGGVLSGGAFVGMACGFSDGSCAVNSGNIGGFLGYYAVGAIPGVFIGRAIGGRMQGSERWREVWRRP